MKTSLAFFSLLAGANAFVPVAPMVSTRAAISSSATSAVRQHVPMRMGLNPELAANFPRDFANVSWGCLPHVHLMQEAGLACAAVGRQM